MQILSTVNVRKFDQYTVYYVRHNGSSVKTIMLFVQYNLLRRKFTDKFNKTNSYTIHSVYTQLTNFNKNKHKTSKTQNCKTVHVGIGKSFETSCKISPIEHLQLTIFFETAHQASPCLGSACTQRSKTSFCDS